MSAFEHTDLAEFVFAYILFTLKTMHPYLNLTKCLASAADSAATRQNEATHPGELTTTATLSCPRLGWGFRAGRLRC